MKTITYCYWVICWGILDIAMVLCLDGVPHSQLGNRSTIYVDCNNGNDTAYCGEISSSPCKMLQFVISKRVQQLETTHVEINIASGDCNENGVLKLYNTKTKVRYWAFVGSNGTSRSPPTIVDFSVESFNSVISFSHITWRNSSVSTLFNIHMSKVTFHYCTFKDVNFQFIGLNTNLIIQNTATTNCTSPNQDIPLFFVQTLYNYDTSIFIKNSTFSCNKRPIIYAMEFKEIFIEDTLFLKNVISNSSLVTVSASLAIFKNSIFSHTVGTAIEVKNTKNFTATNVVFLSNNGWCSGSCLLVRRHSYVSLMNTIFKQNANPVIFVKDDDGVNILLKTCTFDCIQHKEDMNLPFMKTPDGANITATNCTTAKSCLVHCRNGELVKSNLYCQDCKPGSFSYNQNNLILSDSCHSCPAGTYAFNARSENCSLCEEGTYASKSGYKDCKKCTNDFFTSNAGAKSCSKLTLESNLIMAATIPLIVIPLFLLLGRLLQKRSLKLNAQLQSGKKYDRFHPEQTVTTNAVKDFNSQDSHSSY